MDSKAANCRVKDTMPGAEALGLGALYELADKLLKTVFNGERGSSGGGTGGGFRFSGFVCG